MDLVVLPHTFHFTKGYDKNLSYYVERLDLSTIGDRHHSIFVRVSLWTQWMRDG